MLRPRGAARGHPEPTAFLRHPPMTPKAFRQLLLRKKFTYEPDRKLLVEQYAETYAEVMGGVEALSYTDLEWEEPQVDQLALAMTWCRQLKSLTIKCNSFEHVGPIADALPSLPCLQKLQLVENHIRDVNSLGQALSSNTSLEWLHLDGN
eukprot:5856937-Amphidinium_carterae.1